jgi:hypothetical protein
MCNVCLPLPSVTAPLVDSSPRHSSSAMLMLLSVVFLGLAVFFIYKFKIYVQYIMIISLNTISKHSSNHLPSSLTFSHVPTGVIILQWCLQCTLKLVWLECLFKTPSFDWCKRQHLSWPHCFFTEKFSKKRMSRMWPVYFWMQCSDIYRSINIITQSSKPENVGM